MTQNIEVEALAFLEGLYAANGEIDDDEAAHLWRLRLRDASNVDGESRDLARRLAQLPPATSPAGLPWDV